MDRFQTTAQDGFKAMEFLFPYELTPAELQAQLRTHALQQVLFIANPIIELYINNDITKA